MALKTLPYKCVVTTSLLLLTLAHPAFSEDTEALDLLFAQLKEPNLENWSQVEDQIWQEWSKSGSPAFDLLLERGREALQNEDPFTAIEHLTALTDHAPGFAEGWNARATAFYQAEMFGPSISDIEVTLSLNPRHFGALSGLGLIMEQLGYEEEALRAYREVSAIHPHRPNVQDAIERLEARLAGTDL